MITTSTNTSPWFSFSWCCKKKTPQTIDLNKLDEDGPSELQSTSKLTKHPDNDASDAQNGSGSAIQQSVLNSSMLGERTSLQQLVNDDLGTEPVDNDDENCRDESQRSQLHESVLKSSMLGESLQYG